MSTDDDVLAYVRGEKTLDPAPAPLHAVPEPPECETTQPMAVVPVTPAPLAGRQMGFLDQMRHQAGHTLMQVRHARHTQGSLPHRLWHGQPRSMAQQVAYARERRWVKPGHEGGVADKAGAAYHTVLGNPLVAVGNSIAAVGESPLKFAVAYLAGLLPLTELALCGFGMTTLAIWIIVIHVAIFIVVVLTLCAVTGRQDDGTEQAEPVTDLEEN